MGLCGSPLVFVDSLILKNSPTTPHTHSKLFANAGNVEKVRKMEIRSQEMERQTSCK
jgi:hypothetical protein